MTDPYRLLIVGGGPAGLAAARSYRERCSDGGVAIITDEYRLPYERPPLTKELLRGASSVDQIAIEEEEWLERERVDLIGGRAVSLDAERRTVRLSGGRELAYNHCLIATGAEPTRLPIPGADHPRVHVVRSLAHLRELTDRLENAETVAVIGSGFIGCEIAASLRMRGHAVELVSDESAPNAARLGDEAAAILAGWLSDDGVVLHLGMSVERIEHAGKLTTVTAGERELRAEVVVMASGVSPRSELATAAALELDGGAIPVDAAMRTAREGLLAAGDVAKAENLTAGRALRVEHWGDALTQGAIAGCTAASLQDGWSSVPGFWSTLGSRTIKYAAWGDGFDEVRLTHHPAGGFTALYGGGGVLVGVLTYEADQDYEQGTERIEAGAPWKT
jgi:NADPH-dependent 2,4-dienoyl-CoA reductase/sulfur reductase-like enzyme